ncbi:MAG: hypothetical protein LBT83_08240, partial [Tannerella sp.]|nr:hypothetical protein [Tannerella sp.]
YDVQYPTADFYGYVEDGLTYYEFGTRDTHQHFNRLATNACVGVHTFRHAFFVEVTLGLGYAYGFYDESKRRYNEVYGFGYRGLYPVFGLKLGVNLK